MSPFSALVTRTNCTYFSRGFDLSFVNAAKSSAAQWKRGGSMIYDTSIMADLNVMPTICAVTGDSSVVGFMLAFSCDYVAMHGDHEFLCMSEISSLLFHWYILSLIPESRVMMFLRN